MPAEPLTLTNLEILKLHEGLKSLSGVASKANEIQRFDFPASVAWNIAKDEDIIERAAQVHQRAKKALALTHKIVENMKVTDESAPRIAAFIDGEQVLLEQTQELNGLLKLKLADLQKAGMNIPTVLKNLMPILAAE